MNRRNVLKVVGGGVLLAAGGLAAIASRSPAKALEPWQRAGSFYSEPRRKALSYAILAPNPHNRQPWLVDLSRPGTVVLTVDRERLLPHTDPYDRQITIGLGCFLEVMRIAAAEDGYRVDLALFPEGENASALDKRPVAVATFGRDDRLAPDPLFDHVLARRSLKEPYDLGRPVDPSLLSSLVTAVRYGSRAEASAEASQIDRLRAADPRRHGHRTGHTARLQGKR